MQCWLPDVQVPKTLQTPPEVARWELEQLDQSCELTVDAAMGDAFEILDHGSAVRGGECGVLYGAYRLLEHRREGSPPPQGVQTPRFSLRMIDHWDNMNGHIERGYAGMSIFFANDDFKGDDETLRAYARLLASVGINVICLNNVNVAPPAQELIGERFLPDVAHVADIFRPFGIRLLLSIDYSMPVQNGLDTADPLEKSVQDWWNERVRLVYRHVPNLWLFGEGGLGIPPRPLHLRTQPRPRRKPVGAGAQALRRRGGVALLCVQLQAGLARHQNRPPQGRLR